MADSKITALTAISTVDPTADPLVIVDVSDTSMAASGTTKKSTINQLLGAGGTATLASATITGAATVGTTFGVTGVSTFAAGTALLPALTTTGDTNTGIYYPAADTFAVTTAGTERYRVDSSGNVGIGVAASAYGTGIKGLDLGSWAAVAQIGGSSFLGFNVYASTTSQFNYKNTGAIACGYQQGTSGHQWLNAPSNAGAAGANATFTTAMTLDASGNLLVGVSAAPSGTIGGSGFIADSNSRKQLHLATTASASQVLAVFINPNGTVGTIETNGSSTAYNISSDYRLKEEVKPLTGALNRITALKPSTYKWKVDGSVGEGFIAHELAEVVPFAVSGQKDAVNADGSMKTQGVDLSKIVPILVAAIQELTARVQTLETR